MGVFIIYGEELEGLGAPGPFLAMVPWSPSGLAFLVFIRDRAPEAFAVIAEGLHSYVLPSPDAT